MYYSVKHLFTGDPENFYIKDAYIEVDINGIIKNITNKKYEELGNDNDIVHKMDVMIPGFIDAHVHAPQFRQIGKSLGEPLLDWLNNTTFPNESQFKYAANSLQTYNEFLMNMIYCGTTNPIIFGTIHNSSNKLLSNLLERSKMVSYVGKVNSDQNIPDCLKESKEKSINDTIEFCNNLKNNVYCHPIITPRFSLSTSMDLMKCLNEMMSKMDYKLNVQSHISENKSEVEFINSEYNMDYLGTYVKSFESDNYNKMILAHGIHLTDYEKEYLKNNNDKIMIIHCPDSNLILESGIMNLNEYIEKGIKVGIGSDVGAGSTLNMRYHYKLAYLLYRHNGGKMSLKELYLYLHNNNASIFNNKLFKIGNIKEGYYMNGYGCSELNLMMDYTSDELFNLIILDDTQLEFNNTIIGRSLSTY